MKGQVLESNVAGSLAIAAFVAGVPAGAPTAPTGESLAKGNGERMATEEMQQDLAAQLNKFYEEMDVCQILDGKGGIASPLLPSDACFAHLSPLRQEEATPGIRLPLGRYRGYRLSNISVWYQFCSRRSQAVDSSGPGHHEPPHEAINPGTVTKVWNAISQAVDDVKFSSGVVQHEDAHALADSQIKTVLDDMQGRRDKLTSDSLWLDLHVSKDGAVETDHASLSVWLDFGALPRWTGTSLERLSLSLSRR